MDDSIKKTKEDCLEKWREGEALDERLNFFSDHFEDWLIQIPPEYWSTVLVLLHHLSYYTHSCTNRGLQELHNKLTKTSNITDDNTIYTFIVSPDGQSNSSNDYWAEYKLINRINHHICIVDLKCIKHDAWDNYIENVVFIDDFSGTGESFINELKKAPDRYKGKNVYFVTISIMKEAMTEIEKYATSNGLKIFPIYLFCRGKAFDEVFEKEKTEKEKNDIFEMSKKLGIPERQIMGFKNSQGLISFFNNTPNNTLGFIRYDTKKYKSIFPRKNEKKPIWAKIDRSKSRKIANYNNSIRNV